MLGLGGTAILVLDISYRKKHGITLYCGFNPLTAVTAIWRFDAITHVVIYQTGPDKFLTRFDTQCTYSET